MHKVIHLLGDDVSTDVIYPGRYMATMLPSETPQYAFADIEELNQRLTKNPFDLSVKRALVAGDNFGCGSSREQAVSTLVGHDLTVIAKSFARIFKQNAVNLGLRIIICPDIDVRYGERLDIAEIVWNRTRDIKFEITPLPPETQAILDAGGLIPYVRSRL